MSFLSKISTTARIQIIVITSIAIGIYFGLRSIPNAECGFLHYEAMEMNADGIEMCKADMASFIDLSKLEFPLTVTVTPERQPKINEPTRYSAMFRLNNGKLLMPHDIAVSHTQKIHLLIIDNSLGDYQHIHPQPLELSGEWYFDFTPKNPGAYQVFSELIPIATKKNIIGRTTSTIPGESVKTTWTPGDTKQIGNYIFSVHFSETPLTASARNTITLNIENTNHQPVTPEPIMGAYAHLVMFNESLTGMMHLHPLLSEEKLNPLKPALQFMFFTPTAGKYRLWTQVKLDEKELFIPFDIQIQDSH